MSAEHNKKLSKVISEFFECHIKIPKTNQDSVIMLLERHCLKNQIPVSKTTLKKAISKGALWLTRAKHTQRLRRIKKIPQGSDELHFYYNAKVLSTETADAILIDDLIDYSVWFKPCGMLSQGSKWGDHCTIARFAQQALTPERAVYIVHRLDRAATGLILIAHTKKAAQTLSSMFEHHQLKKYYQIIVHGDHYNRSQPDIICKSIDGKDARSTFTCIQYHKVTDQSLIHVKIDSGRKHQIRKHAASINMPVVGDRLYGLYNEKDNIDLQLCAVKLILTCPVSGQVNTFELPEDLKLKLG